MSDSGVSIKGVYSIVQKMQKNASMDAVKTIVKKNADKANELMKRNASASGSFTKGYTKGDTRDSINTRITDGGLTATVSATTEYSAYVEYGTRYMDAEPFAKPAIQQVAPQFRADMEALK